MKYLLPLLLIYSNLSAQKLITNQKDDFTGKIIKRTSWENIGTKGSLSGYTFYIQFSKVNSTNFLKFRTMYSGNNPLSVQEGDELMLKLKDSSIITLKSNEFRMATYGGGATGLAGSRALGFSIDYLVSDSGLLRLATADIVKIRWYTSDGYIEHEIKEKNSKKINDCAKLILE
jgi:hypothetical protein